MFYKTFDEQITRKHGIVVDGWPLPEFENPSSIGSQVELRVLLNAWQSNVARFRKMSENEFKAWKGTCYGDPASSTLSAHPQATAPPLSSSGSPARASSSGSPAPTIDFVQFNPSSTAPLSGVQKKTRKTRSDKGKPRKQRSQISGQHSFLAA